MSEYPVLTHAPIVEALIDIQLDLRNPPVDGIGTFTAFQKGQESRFPQSRLVGIPNLEFQQSPGLGGRTSGPQPNGMQFVSTKNAVQCRLNGFTFSRLNGYDSWDIFIADAQAQWHRYVALVDVAKVKRIAIRYINRIGMPGKVDLADYFQTFPQIAPKIDRGLSSFVMRLVLPQEEGTVAVVTLADEAQSASSPTGSVIFDIDVFRDKLDIQPTDEIWSICDQLRSTKNDIFFASLTERALDEYK